MPEPSLTVGESRIQRKALCPGISSGKAQHSLGNHSWVWGCCCFLPELVCAARWKIPTWSAILFALACPLPERETWLHIEMTLRIETRLSPRSHGAGLGKAQPAAPGEEKEPLALWSVNSREAGEPALAGTAVGGDSSVTLSLCGEMDAWRLRRHEETTRAGARAPL